MGVFSAATFALTDEVQLYGSLSYNKSEQDFVIQPVPISDQFTIPPNHPLFNVAPYNGASDGRPAVEQSVLSDGRRAGRDRRRDPDLLVRYRSVITGNRSLTDTIEQPRGVLGIRGSVAAGTSTAASVQPRRAHRARQQRLSLADSASCRCSTAARSTSSATTRRTSRRKPTPTQFRGDAYETKTTIKALSATVSRELFDLPAGPLAIAFAGEFRKEGFEVDPNATIQTGDISGYGGNFLPIDVERDVNGVLGGARHSDREESRSRPGRALRRLRRHGQQDGTEGQPALAARSSRCCCVRRGARASAPRASPSCINRSSPASPATARTTRSAAASPTATAPSTRMRATAPRSSRSSSAAIRRWCPKSRTTSRSAWCSSRSTTCPSASMPSRSS